MVVEDNFDLRFNLKIILEDNGFEVIEAKNGEVALELLSKQKNLPDLIISDILMPKINGYELLKSLSTSYEYQQIPFIFLTALSSPEDSKYGKLLDADDYLTKPIKEDKLIHIIHEKIDRSKLFSKIYNDFEKKISESIESLNKFNIFLIWAVWDDAFGPKIENIYPSDASLSISANQIISQLFHSIQLIYGYGDISKSENLLINLENLQKSCYIYIDSYPSPEERHGEKIYMLSVIAPQIDYLDSLQVKIVLEKISQNIKDKRIVDLKKYWDKIWQILAPSQSVS